MALAGLLLAVAADATLLHSWPYGLPAATAQASYGTSARHVAEGSVCADYSSDTQK